MGPPAGVAGCSEIALKPERTGFVTDVYKITVYLL